MFTYAKDAEVRSNNNRDSGLVAFTYWSGWIFCASRSFSVCDIWSNWHFTGDRRIS